MKKTTLGNQVLFSVMCVLLLTSPVAGDVVGIFLSTKDGDVPADLARTQKKTWLEVRQDDFYYLHWGHPQFARDYICAFPDKDKYIQGFFYGSDGWTATRDFYSKADVHKNILDIKRLWYTQMLWGRLSYNPETSDQVFINEMAYRYPEAPATTLFDAWSDASRGLPLAAEVIQGTLCFDFEDWHVHDTAVSREYSALGGDAN